MVTNGSSPKRRRTDLGPISAESIRQSNATASLFTGQGSRQNRWMQGIASDTNEQGVGVGAATVQMGGVGPASSLQINTSTNQQPSSGDQQQKQVLDTAAMDVEGIGRGLEDLDALFGQSTAADAGTAASWNDLASTWNMTADSGTVLGGATPRDAIVVDYESPSMPAPTTATPQLAQGGGRKSLDAQTRAATTRQGLPSPAPSEENTTSPIVAEAAMPRRRIGRPPGSKNKNTINPAVNTVRRQDGSLQQVRASQLPASAQQRLPSNGSPMIQQQVHATSPLQMQQPSPATTRSTPATVPSNMHIQPSTFHGHHLPQNRQASSPTLTGYPPTQQAQQAQTRPHVRPLALGDYFVHQALLQAVNYQLQVYERHDPSGNRNRADTGRLSLLREAVQKHDWFYIVLSQLSCLRTCSPTSLPQSMASTHKESYDQLDALICPNFMLAPQLVHFFSTFPRPIMQIYSGSAAQAYEAQVQAVVHFLTSLPRHWKEMAAESVTREAPPLIQDMADRLWLFSPVLQTTAFRAIARMFWQYVPDHEQGIEALVALHHVDQQSYHPFSKRGAADKKRAYLAYKQVFDAWKAYTHTMRLPPQNAMARQQLPPFQIPQQAQAAFGLLPSAQSVLSPTPVQQPQANMQQRQSVSHPPPPSRTVSLDTVRMVHSSASPVQLLQQQLSNQQNVNRMYQQMPPARPGRRLLPPEHECPRPQPTHPDSARSALHQAHIRSPILGYPDAQPDAPRLFRHVSACAMSPQRIDKDKPVQSWTFSPGSESMKKIPLTDRPPERPGQRFRILKDENTTFRLRCCKVEPRVGFPNMSSWVTSDCYWPDTVYFDLNGNALEPRRKLQHGRYLPIDLTEFMQDSDNELKVYINRSNHDKSAFDYAVGVEMVETTTQEKIIAQMNKSTISVHDSLSAIKKSLAGGDADDDDIMMTSSTVTINLFDPISASKIFDTPVRGDKCKHRDPFDLEIFLATRKREKPGHPAVPDEWRCPICRGDVRPDQLRKDAFLVQVREQLKLMDMLDTRAIVVKRDGTWEAKEEERTGVRSASLECEEAAARVSATGPQPKKPAPVVIELD